MGQKREASAITVQASPPLQTSMGSRAMGEVCAEVLG